nr:hypothetical protein [Tanacetum cinerariifolium]
QAEVQEDKPAEEPAVVISKAKTNLPYPSRLQKEKLREKDDILAAKFMEIFRDLHFELSFADALIHIPKFAPIFKKLLNNKDKLIELTKTPLNENCSSVVLKKLLEKLGDPGRFLIPCDFTGLDNCLSLADLRASINLMPLSIWKKLRLPTLNDTKMVLELADRTISKPTGVAENVFVKDYPPWLKLSCVGYCSGFQDLRYFQIPIDPKDQEKTTFTCPYGTFAYKRMPFGLCNAPGTFQRCMMAIFHDMIKKTMEISKKGIKVDKAKIEVISKLPHPTTVKGIRSFLGHEGFYRRFIKDFSKISRPVTHLLEKNSPFIFSNECIQAFRTLKDKLTEAPIRIAPNWDQPFELMCDASDYAVGAVLGQRIEKHFRPIHYASKTMNQAEANYTTTEKEMLAEFDFKVIDTRGAENYAADHLSRLENPYENIFDPKEINETFPLESLNKVADKDPSTSWFADLANYHAGNFIIKGMTSQQKQKFFKDARHYFWEDP